MTHPDTHLEVLDLIRDHDQISAPEIRERLRISAGELAAATRKLTKDGLVAKSRRGGKHMVYRYTRPKYQKPNGWGIPTF